jgi:hypothetical protein
MKSSILTLVIATAVSGVVGPSFAQDKLKAAASPMAGSSKQMAVAGSDGAKAPVDGGALLTGAAKFGGQTSAKVGDAQANAVTESKSKE